MSLRIRIESRIRIQCVYVSVECMNLLCPYVVYICTCLFMYMYMYAQSADVLQLSYATLMDNLGMHDRLFIAHG